MPSTQTARLVNRALKPIPVLCIFLLALTLFAAVPKFDPLPAPVSNNAVASLKTRGSFLLFSLMGLGPKKTWDAVSNATYFLDVDTGKWTQGRPVPGTAGRVGASAVGARDHVFLFGGFVLDAQGGANTLPDVNVYDPLSDRWFRGEDLPVPVGGGFAGVYRDRYMYVVGGWSKTGPVPNVQVYDGQKGKWQQATPISGPPVFGHSGAIVGDTIVYVNGAYPSGQDQPKYLMSEECWIGKIDHKDPTKIQWSKLPEHPGSARYEIAAGGSEKDQMVYFTGGTAASHNYRGLDMDGKVPQPSPVTFAYNLRSSKWEVISESTSDVTIDHHGMLVLSDWLVLIGGMERDQQVTPRVVVLPKQAKP